jgi:UDP-N-acetylmuramoylalanine--D-glutamate ligase
MCEPVGVVDRAAARSQVLTPSAPLRLDGVPVCVVGLGIEGVDLVRFLVRHGATVVVTDRRPATELADAIAAIEGCDVALRLGDEHLDDPGGAEAVFVSQGVPSTDPLVERATTEGLLVSTMLGLFLDLCPVPVTGITGSAGKTTITSLVGAMLTAAGLTHAVGGNIGVGLLGLLDDIGPETLVVVEMSHAQLERVSTSPHVACVSNVTPNHLDRFSWPEYVDLKRQVLRYQTADDVAVLNLDNEVTRAFAAEVRGRLVTTSMGHPPAGDGATLVDDSVVLTRAGGSSAVMPREEILLRGDHNVENVLLAVAVAGELGVQPDAMREAVGGFTGVEHRLEPVATVAGVRYVNDSIASSPTRALAGLRACTEPVVMLLGGRDRQLPKGELAAEVARRCRAVVTFGEAGHLYSAAVRDAPGGDGVVRREVTTVEEAVQAAARLAQEGDVVLLSPGGASFDAYRGFEERGAAFRSAVGRLPGAR